MANDLLVREINYEKKVQFERKSIKYDIEGTLYNKLLKVSKFENIEVFKLMFSTFKFILHKYSTKKKAFTFIAAHGLKTNNVNKIEYFILSNELDPQITFIQHCKNSKSISHLEYNSQLSIHEKIYSNLIIPNEQNDFNVLFIDSSSFDDKVSYEIMNESKCELIIQVSNNLYDDYKEIIFLYNDLIFEEETIRNLYEIYVTLLGQVVENPSNKLSEYELVSKEEKQKLLFEFNDTKTGYPRNKTIHKLFEEMVDSFPERIALEYENDTLTYKELDDRANNLANYLLSEHGLVPETIVAVIMDKSFEAIVAVLGILKAGGAYVPIDPSYPESRIKLMLEDNQASIVISSKKYIRILNKLQWECNNFKAFICLDSDDIYSEQEETQNQMMDEDVWKHVGSSADDIQAGSWINSYTGEPFSETEIKEHSDNIFIKIKPYLSKDIKVLEIGCGSGFSMFKIAPYVDLYYGTDLSNIIIERNYKKIEESNIQNIKLKCLPAHDIEKIDECDFDIVIMNSVVQCFHGHNYLRKVISKVIKLMSNRGIIFFGDIMDQNRKYELIRSCIEYKKNNTKINHLTKTNWDAELFLSPEFFDDLRIEFSEIEKVQVSDKIHTIENELTKFRNDILVYVNKEKPRTNIKLNKNKIQHSASDLKKYSKTRPEIMMDNTNLAYVIYTSGTTGKPKGAMVEHKNAVRLFVNDNNLFNFDENDVWTMFHSFCFDFSVWEMYGALLFGGKLIIVPKFVAQDTKKYLDLLLNKKVTILNQTPSALYNLIKFEKELSENSLLLRYVILGGEALKPIKLKVFHERYPNTKLINMYGVTETTVHVTYKEITRAEIEKNSGNVGKPIPTLTTYIMNKDLDLLPIGMAGEICVGGEGVCRGYLNRLYLTKEKFVVNPYKANEILYRTGDLAKLTSNGEIIHLGRIDNQVKIRGHRIEIGEIEAALEKNPYIDQAVVVEKESKNRENYLVGYIKLKPESSQYYQRKKRYKLPNNMAIIHQNRNETDFMYKEIFEEKSYFKHGITIGDGEYVFDIGANIGMFSLFVNQIAKDVKIYAFEPIPDTYSVLALNAELYGNNIKTFEVGVSDREKELEFTFYPKASVMSGCYSNTEHDEVIFEQTMKNAYGYTEFKENDIEKFYKEITEYRFEKINYICKLKSLSNLIEENKITKIDLLKIDVEKSELDVLNGIKQDDWRKIKQVVLEVHDISGQLEKIENKLKANNFEVFIEGESILDGTGIYFVYGINIEFKNERAKNRISENEINKRIFVEDKIITSSNIKKYLKDILPEYMIPSYFAFVEKIPLTPNGKLDKKSLPTVDDILQFSSEEYQAPQNNIEMIMSNIWSEVLGVENVGINDNFFDLGGHSLKIAILLTKIHEAFCVKMHVAQIFKTPTIKALSKYIEGAKKVTYPVIEVIEEREYYPVTAAQKRMFIMNQLDTESKEYNVPLIMIVEGVLDVKHFEKAFNELIKRHEILRTSFEFREGEVVQIVHKDIDFRVGCFEGIESNINEYTEKFIRKFDLSKAPLLRVDIVRIKNNKYLWMFDIHHIITDGISMNILINELTDLYEERNLPINKIQYKDYAVWNSKILDSSIIKNQEKFWMSVFEKELVPLNFPLDFPRENNGKRKGANINIALDGELIDKLNKVASDNSATLFMVLLSGFYILLHKYTGQEDIVVSSGSAGRTHKEVNNILGLFINTLMMRNYPRSNISFKKFLKEVKNNTIDVYDNQLYPYDRLVEKMQIKRENGRIPMNDIVFVLENMELNKSKIKDLKFVIDVEIEGLNFIPIDGYFKVSRSDIFMCVVEQNNDISITLEYCVNLFRPETMGKFLENYVKILNFIAENETITIGEIDLLEDYQKQKIIDVINKTESINIDFDF